MYVAELFQNWQTEICLPYCLEGLVSWLWEGDMVYLSWVSPSPSPNKVSMDRILHWPFPCSIHPSPNQFNSFFPYFFPFQMAGIKYFPTKQQKESKIGTNPILLIIALNAGWMRCAPWFWIFFLAIWTNTKIWLKRSTKNGLQRQTAVLYLVISA